MSESEAMKPQVVTVTRTYLAIEQPDQLVPSAARAPALRLDRLHPCPVALWRTLYARIGGPWHWHDRDAWSDDALRTHLARGSVAVYVVRPDLAGHDASRAGQDTGADRAADEADDTDDARADMHPPADAAGMLELERHADGSVEIVYLGLDRRLIGQGAGGWLVTTAVREAFAFGASRVWLHTCTLDAPAALPNYLARGFVVTRTEQYEAAVAP